MNNLKTPQENEIMTKVANIILDPRFGGPQNRILQVAKKLKEFGVETLVIIPEVNSETFHSKLTQNEIAVKRMQLHRLTKDRLHFFGWLFFFIPEVIALARVLKQERIEVVHCNASLQMKGVIAAKLAGCKAVWHLNDSEFPTLLKWIFKILARWCDGFILAGSRVCDFYFSGKAPTDKICIEIQAPVDTSRYDPDTTTASDLPGVGPKMIIVGTINPTKRIEDFILSAAILTKRYANLQFYIVGPELDSQLNYIRGLKALIQEHGLDNVHFLGARDDVPSLLKAVDVYVCTSGSEASPMAVWEAMSMKKAVVSTDVGDVRVFIKDGVNGFIVPKTNITSIADKISILVENASLRKKFGERAREVTIKELNLDIAVKKHFEIYKMVLSH